MYVDNYIRDGKIAIIEGGHNNGTISEMIESFANVPITGISNIRERYWEIHKPKQENYINVLGGMHYSTENLHVKGCGIILKIRILLRF